MEEMANILPGPFLHLQTPVKPAVRGLWDGLLPNPLFFITLLTRALFVALM